MIIIFYSQISGYTPRKRIQSHTLSTGERADWKTMDSDKGIGIVMDKELNTRSQLTTCHKMQYESRKHINSVQRKRGFYPYVDHWKKPKQHKREFISFL